MHGQRPSTPSRRIWPKAATVRAPISARSSSSRASGELIESGRITGRPSSWAAAATAVGVGRPERPRRRSGWLTTSASSWWDSARARRGATAATGLPAKATLTSAAGAKRPQGLPALLGRRAVDDQDAVEVVDLVLDHPRAVALQLQLER